MSGTTASGIPWVYRDGRQVVYIEEAERAVAAARAEGEQAERALLERADSICSLVAHRGMGIDDEMKDELLAVSRAARAALRSVAKEEENDITGQPIEMDLHGNLIYAKEADPEPIGRFTMNPEPDVVDYVNRTRSVLTDLTDQGLIDPGNLPSILTMFPENSDGECREPGDS